MIGLVVALEREIVLTVTLKSTVRPEAVVQNLDRPVLSEEEIERKSKSIIDEFLHINDYKVVDSNITELMIFDH